MTDTQESDTKENGNFFRLFKKLLNLRADTDKAGTVDLIKANIEFRSANAWTLVFAIFIASVGLNVNSTAVVIGAMLISPLMGPIVGAGFALGTYDFHLLNKSAKNLAAAVIISLATSTIYFLISPLSEVQSELLARTRPSFFDVLIAFFGGAAGIVAISRKEKGNAIPGVAIATALMPPLCTAGFGLASRNFSYFLGAMYLFIINSVFISISTLIFVRYLKFHEIKTIDSEKQKYTNRWVTYVGAAVLIPSFFMAWFLRQESLFKSHAHKYISQEIKSENLYVVEKEISYNLSKPKIKVSLLGEPLTKEQLALLKSKANNYSLNPESVEIHQSTLSENLEKKIGEKLSAADNQTSQLQLQLKKYEFELTEYKAMLDLSKKISNELAEFLPRKISNIYIMKQEQTETEPLSDNQTMKKLKAIIQWRTYPSKSDRKMAKGFLVKRLEIKEDQIKEVRDF